jgi:tetratricopeptide (TPR) repeat protein
MTLILMKTMLRRAKMLMALVSVALAAAADAAPPAFEEANRLFEQGDFAGAKERYERLAVAGETSANLYFNLGNAEFRLGAPGRAALGFQRALALEPAHAEAARNLEFVRGQTGARLLPGSWLDQVLAAWPVDVYVLTAAVAAWVSVGCIAMLFSIRSRSGIWLALAGALMIGAYAGTAIWRDTQRRSLAVVTVPEAVARFDAADHSKAAETLPAGSVVRVRAHRGAFLYCDLPSGVPGWLRVESVQTVYPSFRG